MDKQVQTENKELLKLKNFNKLRTVYLVNNGYTDLCMQGYKVFEYMNKQSGYFFTPEEMKEHDRGVAEMAWDASYQRNGRPDAYPNALNKTQYLDTITH